jgi:hypothetical protein
LLELLRVADVAEPALRGHLITIRASCNSPGGIFATFLKIFLNRFRSALWVDITLNFGDKNAEENERGHAKNADFRRVQRRFFLCEPLRPLRLCVFLK